MPDFINLFNVGVAWVIAELVIRIVALFVVPRNRKPSSATAWLLLIFLLPTFGMVLYLIVGSPKLPLHRRESQKTLDKLIKRALTSIEKNHDNESLLSVKAPRKYQSIASLSESLSHLPVFGGNKLDALSDYDKAITSIVSDIEKANHFVHIEYFIIALDDTTEPIFDAMARAADRGVVVRVMYDSLATRGYPNKKQMLKRLRDDGVLVQPMLPFKFGKRYVRPDLRNHRKLVVIDGHVGYTGSQNLIQKNYHRKDEIYYDELVVRMQGPVVVQLAAVFLTDWYSETNDLLEYKRFGDLSKAVQSHGDSMAQILPSGPGYEDENNLKLFTSLIHTAEANITIVNPYFVPEESLLTAITSAARRGVEITMINSEAMDQWMVGHAQRSFYEALLDVGVKIYLYKAPVLLHSKFMMIDGEIAVIGSSNLDIRSFELNLEVSLISYDAKFVGKLNSIANDYLKRAKQMTQTEWGKRSRRKILLDNIARLTSALQ